MKMLAENIEILRSIVEEKLYRVYEISPWLSTEEILKKHLKKVGGRYKKKPNLLQDLIKLTDGEKAVLDVSKELRLKGHRVSPEDVIEIYERYRRKGIVRVRTVKALEIEKPVETYMKTTVVQAEEIVEKLREVPDMERVTVLKQELDKLLSKLEDVSVPVAEEIPQPRVVPIRKVAEDIIKIRMSGLIDNLFTIDEWVEVILLATREGDPMVFFSRSAETDINQANLAAASAVIYSVSKTGSDSFEKGNVKEILILARGGYILLRPISKEYIMISLIHKSAKLGIALRDLGWISKELEKILEGASQEELIK